VGLLVIRRLRDRSSPGRRDYSPRAGSASFQEAPVDTAGHLTRCAGAPTEYLTGLPGWGQLGAVGRYSACASRWTAVEFESSIRSSLGEDAARRRHAGLAEGQLRLTIRMGANARSAARGRRRNHAARGDPVQSALRPLTPGCRRPGEGLVGGSSGMPPQAPIDAHDAFSECNGVNELYRVIINCSDLEGAGGTGSLARAWCAARDSNPEPADEESADPTQLHCQPWQC